MKPEYKVCAGAFWGNRAFVLAISLAMIGFAVAEPLPPDPSLEEQEQKRLTRLSLSELTQLEVTSVSRREERLLKTASAVYIITQEDIQRSGAQTIPEALRMAPGLSVAQINANKWAISSRGFNGRFANKLLVLIDGRTVYNPLFSGVYWDIQDTMLEDIERIEVIRGPGATIWGANAVNGVINIITKKARDTQGGLVVAGAGNEEQGFGAARYGGELSENAHYRVYAKFFNRDDFVFANGNDAADEWHGGRTGFRLDWIPAEENEFTFQGDYYDLEAGDSPLLAIPGPPFTQTAMEKARAKGGNFISRWKHSFAEGSDLTVQAYYDRNQRRNAILDVVHDTVDFDLFHNVQLGERNNLTYGAGYRLILDDIKGTFSSTYSPSSRQDQLVSAFIQDEISLVPEILRLTLGTKVEHNDYSGFEIQPNGRLLYTPTDRQSVWAAVSRAVRTPSRFEHDVVGNVATPAPFPIITVFSGDSSFDPEELLAYELGYRIMVRENLSFDIATFYNVYDDLRTSEQTVVPGFPTFVLVSPDNRMEGESYGVELATQWAVTKIWKLNFGYTFLRLNLHAENSTSATAEGIEGDDPRNQFHVRSFLDLPFKTQFDTMLYYVDSLSNQNVPSYVRLDARIAWRPRHNLEFSLVGQNLLDDRHPEFGVTGPLVTPTQIQRSVYGKVAWRF